MKYFRIFLLFLLAIRLLTFFLTKIDLKTGDLVQISGIISEEPKIYYKTVEVEVNGKYVVEIPMGMSAVESLRKNKKMTVVGKVECQIFPSSVGAQHARLAARQVVPLQKAVDCRQIISAKSYQVFSNGIFENLLNFFDGVKNQINLALLRFFPKDEAQIMSGILLGETKGVSKTLLDSFYQTGTIHLFAASGMNLVLFCGFLSESLQIFFQKRKVVLISIFASVFYVFLSGFSPSILRAVFMFAFVNLAGFFGRPSKPIYSLGFASLFLIFLNPEIITSLGFQLSVLSTLAIVLLPREFKMQKSKCKMTMKNEKFKGNIFSNEAIEQCNNVFCWLIGRLWGVIRVDLAISVSCFLFTAPLIVFSFGKINLLSVIVNLSVLWMIELLMFSGIFFVLAFFVLGRVEVVLNFLSFLIFPLIFLFKQIILLFSRFDSQVPIDDYRDRILIVGIFLLGFWMVFLMTSRRKSRQ